MPHFVLPERRANEPISSMPGIAQQGLENVVKQIGKDLELGIRAVLLFGHPEHGGKTPDGAAAAAAERRRAEGLRALEARVRRRARRHDGRVLVRLHRSRPLRRSRRRPRAERRVAGAARRHGREPRARRRRRRRAVRHDGRPRRRDSRRARRCRVRGHGADVVRREVRVGVLRPVPRSGRLARRRAATGRATRWTSAIRAKPCARRCSTSRKAPTGSW